MHTVEALDRLILFRQKPDSLLRRLMSSEEAVRVAAQGELVALAVENGWQGDLWRCCIAWTLTEHENPFSLSWERRTGPEDTLSALALADMAVFHALLSTPPEEGPWPLLRNFHQESRQGKESAPLTELAAALAERDKAGYLLTNERMETATPGFFAAGDCRQKTVRQLTTAVSDGTLAAVAACEWLAVQETEANNQNGRAHAAR